MLCLISPKWSAFNVESFGGLALIDFEKFAFKAEILKKPVYGWISKFLVAFKLMLPKDKKIQN